MDALLTEAALEAGGLPPFKAREAVEPPRTVPFAVVPRESRRPWRRYGLPLAACFCLLTAAGFFTGRYLQSTVWQPVIVATITDTDAAAEATGLRIGQPLTPGVLRVPEKSEIGLAMRSGARLKIRGPSELNLDGVDQVRLSRGLVSTYAPLYAHGFTIRTQDGKIVDLGTRFVTASGGGHGTEVHVLEGLVDAYSNRPGAGPQGLKGENAAILKDGAMKETEYLARRLEVPLDPLLTDADHDGFPDVVEVHFGTDPKDAASQPEPLRVEESFSGYPIGAVNSVPERARGGAPHSLWMGGGNFIAGSLDYQNHGKKLRVSGGALQTSGRFGVGAVWIPNEKEFPPEGVIYMSFIMRLPSLKLPSPFAGMILYQGDREEMFVGKLSVTDDYGSRMQQGAVQDGFQMGVNGESHLFVVRIDRTRLVTDIFVDPVLGEAEVAQKWRIRYQTIPDFDRIMFRSGSASGDFPVVFDEFRSGLTWDAVVPLVE